MKTRAMAVAGLAVILLAAGAGMADDFGIGVHEFTIDFMTVSGSTNPASGYGIVDYNYRIGTYEITNDQWAKFAAAYGKVDGTPSCAYDMDPHWTDPDQPINGVSWYEAAQFVNWLNISTGHQAAYKFTGTQGTSSYALATWSVEEAACGGTNLYRHKEAFYYLPTENEWVKAAYWNGVDLQTYATKNNGTPGEWRPTGGPSSDGQAAGWNYGHAYPSNTSATGQPWEVTEGYSPEELNGTFDMMGNVWEWTESPYDDTDFETDSSRAVRGGSHYDYRVKLESPSRTAYGPDYESSRGGFRVAAVPEPASLALVLLGGLALVVKGKRR